MFLDAQSDKLTDPVFMKALLENFPTKDSKGETLPTIEEYRQAAPPRRHTTDKTEKPPSATAPGPPTGEHPG